MLSFSAAVSPELRSLMEKARTTANDMRKMSLTGVEQTAVLHAQPEHERGGAEEIAECARGRRGRCVEGVRGTLRAEDCHEVRRHAQADHLV